MSVELKTDIPEFSSVQEKILFEKHYFVKTDELEGPIVELFFHEIKDQAPKLRRFFDLLFGTLLMVLHLLLFPFIALGLKFSGKKSIFQPVEGIGIFGRPLSTKVYNIGVTQFETTNQESSNRFNFFCRILYTFNMFKLPQLWYVITGKMSLVGPELLSDRYATKYVNAFTDFHKRFSPLPGVFAPVSYYIPPGKKATPNYNLKKDLIYSCKQSMKQYFRILFSKNRLQR